MIESFKLKGLRELFSNGTTKKINSEHHSKLMRQMDRLDKSKTPNDMRLPGWSLHKLSGTRQDTWAVRVSGNWRLTFKFENQNAYDVNFEDYH